MVVDANQPTWKAIMPFNLVAPLHDLPKHPERVLPKFGPIKSISAEDHLKSLYPALNLLNVEHEYVVSILFPYTFEHKASACTLVYKSVQ